MRKLIVIGFGLVLAGNALAQGTIAFANNGLTPTPPDRLVRFQGVAGATDGQGVVNLGSSVYVAQLYLGSDSGNSMAPAALISGPSNFRATTTSFPGTWILVNGTFTLGSGVDPGETVSLIVRVWDSDLFASFDAAVTAGGIVGQSAPFNYSAPLTTGSPPPSAFDMINFQGFNIMAAAVPEPSVFALGALGVVGLMCLRRRKV